MHSFLADTNHAKVCLGLEKDSDGYKINMYASGGRKLIKLRLNKKKCHNLKKIVSLFIQAFDELDIEIFSED